MSKNDAKRYLTKYIIGSSLFAVVIMVWISLEGKQSVAVVWKAKWNFRFILIRKLESSLVQYT